MFTRKFTRMLYRVRENFIFPTSDRQFIGIVCFIIYLLYYIIYFSFIRILIKILQVYNIVIPSFTLYLFLILVNVMQGVACVFTSGKGKYCRSFRAGAIEIRAKTGQKRRRVSRETQGGLKSNERAL